MGGKRVSHRRSRSDCDISRQKKRKMSSRSSTTPPLKPPGKTPCSESHDFTVLSIPIKSPNDPKSYKVIQLSNGLTALLISDMSCVESREKIQRNRNCVDTRIEKFNKDILGITGEVDCCGVKTTKPNPTPVTESPFSSNSSTKVHSSNCECGGLTAAITLSAGAGNFHDPKEIPGLAHLLEHVTFCGSTKYPGSTTFDAFLSENDGIQSNGTTWGGETLFYFGVEQKDLPTGLDMFVNLFISPTMSLVDIQKEREVVDAEFNGIRDNDTDRVSRLLQTTGLKDHPATHFYWGSRETIVSPDGKDESLQKVLRQFHTKYYGAQHMTVAIQAPEPIEKLQRLVVEYFGKIPKSTQDVSIPFPKDILPYDTPEFTRFYSIIPVNDIKQLHVTWELPISTVSKYQAKTLTYLTRFISNASHGGLVQYLKNRNLIVALASTFGGADGHHYDRNDASVLFYISFTLTEPTPENVLEILEALFSYLKFMEKVGPQEWFYNELKCIQALKFHFLDDMDPIENSQRMARNLRFYEPRDCLTGDLLPILWEPQAITACLKMLTPSKANCMMLAKSLSYCNKEEFYFKTKYAIENICQDRIRQWETVKPYNQFKLCAPNAFITTNFCVVESGTASDDECEDTPKCILRNDKIEMWNLLDLNMRMNPQSGYKMDSYTEYHIGLRSPVPLYTVQGAVMLEVWIILLQFLLHPCLHGAVEAHLNYSIHKTQMGVQINVKGFSQKLTLILNQILQYFGNMDTLVNQITFESGKNTILTGLYNGVKSASSLARQLRVRIFSNNFWTFLEQYNALVEITYTDFQRFCKEFKEQMYAVGLAQGNVSPKGTLSLANSILEKLNYQPLHKSAVPEIRLSQIPKGDTVLCTRSINSSSKSSSIQCYYQVETRDAYDSIICKLITYMSSIFNDVQALMEGPAFQELRTNQNLGYNVSVTSQISKSTSDIIIIVNCQSDKFTGAEIKTRIDKFVKDFYESNIRKLTGKDLLNVKSCLSGMSGSEGEQNFREIVGGQTSSCNALEKLFKKIKVRDVQDWYKKYLIPGTDSKMRKLTIQVVGLHDTEYEEEIIQKPRTNNRRKLKVADKFPLTVLTPYGDNNNGNEPITYVRNINEFKSTLLSYPLPTKTK